MRPRRDCDKLDVTMTLRMIATGLLAAACLPAQSPQKVFYFPKPTTPTVYQAPMKPLVRLADLKAKHRGSKAWQEVLVDDGNSKAAMIAAPPGSRYERRLYPDSPAWWVIVEGAVRFEIERPGGGFETIDARKGSYVYVPERMLHSLEVTGTGPAIRFEVTLAQATPVFEKRPTDAPPGIEHIPVRLGTGTNELDVPDPGGKPWPSHVNIYELAERFKDKPRWSVPAMRKNRARGNFICGLASAEPPLQPGQRGHFHADFAEFWIVMLGELTWQMEGIAEPLHAREGDVVYAPPKTFHIPRFHGPEGVNCRLTSSTYPNANHIFDAAVE